MAEDGWWGWAAGRQSSGREHSERLLEVVALVTQARQARQARESTAAAHRLGIERAIELMRADLAAPLCLADLAGAARMSEFHFARVFRELTGLPPLRFLSALRLAEARDLLIGTDEAVIQICLQVGYSSVGTFTRRFTELVGIPPLSLRQHARAGQVPALRLQPDGGAAVRVFVTGVAEHEPASPSPVIAVFETPLPFGRPTTCAVARGCGALFPSGLGPGQHYFFAFARAGQAYACTSPVLVAIRDPTGPYVAHMTLRRAAPTDPPLLSCIPFILYSQHFDG